MKIPHRFILALVAILVAATLVQATPSPGPDGALYRSKDQFASGPNTPTWPSSWAVVDISGSGAKVPAPGGTTAFLDDDEYSQCLDLDPAYANDAGPTYDPNNNDADDFIFPFYGVDFECIYVQSNGLIVFNNNAVPTAAANQPVGAPNSAPPNAIVAAYWTDLQPDLCGSNINAGVFYRLEGTAPSRQFVVQWNQVRVRPADQPAGDYTGSCAGPAPAGVFVTFQVRIREADGGVDVLLRNVDVPAGGINPRTATLGTENGAGTQGLQYIAGQTPIVQFADRIIRYFPNHAPVIMPKALTIDEDAVGTSVELFITDPSGPGIQEKDGDALEIVSLGPFKGGSASDQGSGKISYVPSADVCTHSAFAPASSPVGMTYTVRDILDGPGGPVNGVNVVGHLPITVNCVNDPPVFDKGLDIVILEDQGPYVQAGWADPVGPGPATALDEATQGLAFTVNPVAPALFSAGPAIAIMGTPKLGDLSFTPALDRCTPGGPTTLTAVLTDDGGTPGDASDDKKKQETFKVTISCVNDPPKFNMFDKDQGPSGGGLQTRFLFVSAISPGGGPDEASQAVSFTVTTNRPALFATQPAVDGQGTLTYAIKDNVCAVAEVYVVAKDNGPVAPQSGNPPHVHQSAPKTFLLRSDCPTQAVNDDRAVKAGSTSNPIKVLVNDAPQYGVQVTGVTATSQGGTVNIAPDGSVVFYTPKSGFTGTDSFTYTIADVFGQTASAKVHVVVTSSGMAAVGDAYSILEDSLADIAASEGVLSNDLVPPGGAAALVAKPTRGDLVLQPDGSFTYDPDPDWHGTDSFTYRVQTGAETTAPVTVTLKVLPVNDAPATFDDYYTLRPGKSNVVVPAGGVLVNDKDADGDPIQAVLVQSANHGSLSLNQDGSFSYWPTPGYTGPDIFRYRATDGVASSIKEGLVHITVAANQPPVAAFKPAKDSVAVGTQLTFADQSYDPDTGIAQWNWDFGDGARSTERFPTHRYSAVGEYSVRLVVKDLDGMTAVATRVVHVTAQFNQEDGGPDSNTPPVAQAGPDQTVFPFATVTLDGSSGDGARALAHHWVQIAGPRIAIDAPNQPKITFNAPSLLDGNEVVLRFEYTIFDGQRLSEPDHVDVRVVPVPLPEDKRLKANAGDDRDVLAGSTVTLAGSASNHAPTSKVAFRWLQVGGPDLGIVGDTAEITFTVPVEHAGKVIALRLEVTVDGKTATDDMDLTIKPRVATEPFRMERGRGEQNGIVAFEPLREGRSYAWDFGDGTSTTEATPIHIYLASGTYTVTLTVTYDGGATESFSDEVRIFIPTSETKDKGAPLAWWVPLLALVILLRRRSA